LLVKSKKAALGFKIATIAFLSIPLLLLIPFACEPADNGYGDAAFPPLIIPCAIFVLIARAILMSKRKRFYKAIADTECKLIQEQCES